ncbi:MAG TPA: hypothetical protein VE967_12880, partial [Gemmatimonadaceae bacterium]|nr:hypothetical protein [Gemmatimonadaceae bacterium]
YFWRAVGTRMGITDIPPWYDEFEAWSRAYEKAQFRFAETNKGIGSATRDLFVAWFPRVFTPFVRYGIYASLDDDMIRSFGFPQPLPGTRALLRGALKARGFAIRFLPPRKKAHFFTDNRNRTHPEGYEISALGPPRLVEAEKKARSKP